MMRISTSWIYQQSVDLMMRGQVQLSRTQAQVASGQRMQLPSDDPIAAARITELQRAQSEVEQWQRNTLAAQNRLTLSEGALADATQILQRLRELAIQGNNGTMGAEARKALAPEAAQLADQLVQLANIRDADGQYLFAGTTNFDQPFIRADGGVQYLGDNQQRLLPIGPATRIADGETGQRVFMGIPGGNGLYAADADAANAGSGIISLGPPVQGAPVVSFTIEFGADGEWEALDGDSNVIASGTHEPGEMLEIGGARVRIDGNPADGDSFQVTAGAMGSVFDIADRMAAALLGTEDDAAAVAVFHSEMNGIMADLDQALGVIIDSRSRVGARLAAIDQQDNLNKDNEVQLERYISELRDVDYASAISKMNQQMVALQAAQASFMRVTGLSLFNYL